jgi:thioredoxin-like negative regulator of GroEL
MIPSAVDNAILSTRLAYDRRAWEDAYDALSRASAAGPLGADHVERLAWSAMLTGRDELALEVLLRLGARARGSNATAPRIRRAEAINCSG